MLIYIKTQKPMNYKWEVVEQTASNQLDDLINVRK